MTRNDHRFLSTSSFAPSSGSDEEMAEEVDPKNELKEMQERQKKKKMIKKEAQQELVALKRINRFKKYFHHFKKLPVDRV